MNIVTIICGDALEILRTLPAESVHCCVTSPPYWSLRDYGVPGQIGLERTPEKYVEKLVEVFRAVRRVLRRDGTLWLNLGDCYAATRGSSAPNKDGKDVSWKGKHGENMPDRSGVFASRYQLKPKDLVGIPWLVAFALRDDGWYLRSDIIWAKPNSAPESVTDRPTKAHEYVFLLSKSKRYYYNAEAVAEPYATPPSRREKKIGTKAMAGQESIRPRGNLEATPVDRYYGNGYRNRRSVWTIATRPYRERHFAVMPSQLAEICVKAGCPSGGVVLDPFGGAGTTGMVAARLLRDAILIELNPRYCEMAARRIRRDGGMFVEVISR